MSGQLSLGELRRDLLLDAYRAMGDIPLTAGGTALRIMHLPADEAQAALDALPPTVGAMVAHIIVERCGRAIAESLAKRPRQLRARILGHADQLRRGMQ